MMISQNLLTIFLAMPGGMEWIMIILAVLLLFGGKKIPELMKGIGKGIKEFKDAKHNVKQELEDGMMEKDRELTKLKEPLRS